MSAAPGGPNAHPRSRLRRACRLGAAGGRRADSATSEGEPGPAAGEGYAVRLARAGGAAAAAPLFSAGRRSGPRRRGPRGAGARWGHERVGTSAGQDSGPRLAPPPCPGPGARPCRRVGSCGGGCPAPTGRSHVCVCRGEGGAELRPVLSGTGKTPLSRRIFVWAAGRAGAPSPPASAPFPFACPQAQATRPTPGGSPEPEAVLGTRAAEVGVFHQPGRVKFENKLQAEKAREAVPAAASERRLDCLSDVLCCLKLRSDSRVHVL